LLTYFPSFFLPHQSANCIARSHTQKEMLQILTSMSVDMDNILPYKDCP
jgi:hypothetical protein